MSKRVSLMFSLLAGLIGGGVGCQQPQPPTSSTPDAASAALVDPSPSASVATSLASSRRADGCWGLDLPAAPASRVETVAKRCAQGMTPLAPLSTVSVTVSGVDWTSPVVKAGSCVRVIAAMPGGVEVALVDAQGRSVASDKDLAFSIAPSRGPLCVSGDGPLKVRLTPIAGEGAALVGAWATTP